MYTPSFMFVLSLNKKEKKTPKKRKTETNKQKKPDKATNKTEV